MSEGNDKDNDDINFYPDDNSDIEKVWVVDWNNKFQRTSSEEKTNYLDALKIFNEKAKEGKNTILYEVQKSISNGKILKTMPVLNSKHAERDNKVFQDKKEPAIKKDRWRWWYVFKQEIQVFYFTCNNCWFYDYFFYNK